VRFLGPGGLTGDYDGFATYPGRTDGRRIPVVVLERAR
jgi:hypothetical protein